MEWTSIIDCAYDATITLSGSASTTRKLTIQLLDYAGNNLTVKNVVYWYISSDAAGEVLTIVDKIDTTSGEGGDVLELLADSYWMGISEDDGTIDIKVEESNNIDVYNQKLQPNG